MFLSVFFCLAVGLSASSTRSPQGDPGPQPPRTTPPPPPEEALEAALTVLAGLAHSPEHMMAHCTEWKPVVESAMERLNHLPSKSILATSMSTSLSVRNLLGWEVPLSRFQVPPGRILAAEAVMASAERDELATAVNAKLVFEWKRIGDLHAQSDADAALTPAGCNSSADCAGSGDTGDMTSRASASTNCLLTRSLAQPEPLTGSTRTAPVPL